MKNLALRPAGPEDIGIITAIYNSNPEFLLDHLGVSRVREKFLREEMLEMQRQGFTTQLFTTESGQAVGLADYRPDQTAYLSLLMLDASIQGQGWGRRCYALLEQELLAQGCAQVRLDAAQGPHSPAPFWEKLGFTPGKTIRLTWGGHTFPATVMHKDIPSPKSSD